MIKAHTVQSVYTFPLWLPLYLISPILKDEHKSIIFTWTYMHTHILATDILLFVQYTTGGLYCLFFSHGPLEVNNVLLNSLIPILPLEREVRLRGEERVKRVRGREAVLIKSMPCDLWPPQIRGLFVHHWSEVCWKKNNTKCQVKPTLFIKPFRNTNVLVSGFVLFIQFKEYKKKEKYICI